MGFLIAHINVADRIARMWLEGSIAALTAQEMLAELGFTDVEIGDRSIPACFNGVRFDLPGDVR